MSQQDQQQDESDCEYYNQCLGFEDDSTVTALSIGILLIIIFLFIASIWHRQSNLEHLLFITSSWYLYFYVICIINFFVILVSVTFLNYTATYSQISVGITLILTAISTMLVNVIGCKYYRSYMLMKKCKLRLLKFIGITSLILLCAIACALLYYSVWNTDERSQISFNAFLIFMLVATITHTSIASLASKLAQIEWILLMCFAVAYIESFNNTRYEPFNLFLIYWHPILLCTISVAAIFFISPFNKLRTIAVGIFSCFIAMFDLVTDVNVIYVWISNKHYIWASLQTLFILAGCIFSGYYVKDYYGFVRYEDNPMGSPMSKDTENTRNNRKESYDPRDDEKEDSLKTDDDEIQGQDSMIAGQNTEELGGNDDEVIKHQGSFAMSHKTFSEYVPSKRMQHIGQLFTFIGLGRLWHGFLGWDSEKNKDMMISNRILKVWEMIFGLLIYPYMFHYFENKSHRQNFATKYNRD